MPEPRALVVDDNPTNRILARALLSKLGWPVDDVDGGGAALARLEHGRYTLILLDVSMPGLSGEETCRAMRDRPDGAGLRIVAYTAHAYDDERARIMAAGFDDILIKPVTMAAMEAVVGRP